MTLERAIAAWDGKSAEFIYTVYATHHQSTTFVSDLIVLLAHAPLQKGATWLLKKWLEEGGVLSAESSTRYYQTATRLAHWESQLHLLQSMSYIPITASDVDIVYTFVLSCLSSRKTFVRAWAYSGMYELASHYPQFQDETRALFDKAMAEEKASVRARIRQVMKRGF